MSRLVWLVLVVMQGACGSRDERPEARPLVEGEKVAVPGGGAVTGARAHGAIDRFHLEPEEGTLSIDRAEAAAGAEATATIAVAPGAGYHVNTDFPTALTLVAPDGVKLARSELAADKKTGGDAEAFSERSLVFAVKASAAHAGAYDIQGTFDFAVCQDESCHAKHMPITIRLAAK